jgi:hypothetical protein
LLRVWNNCELVLLEKTLSVQKDNLQVRHLLLLHFSILNLETKLVQFNGKMLVYLLRISEHLWEKFFEVSIVVSGWPGSADIMVGHCYNEITIHRPI